MNALNVSVYTNNVLEYYYFSGTFFIVLTGSEMAYFANN